MRSSSLGSEGEVCSLAFSETWRNLRPKPQAVAHVSPLSQRLWGKDERGVKRRQARRGGALVVGWEVVLTGPAPLHRGLGAQAGRPRAGPAGCCLETWGWKGGHQHRRCSWLARRLGSQAASCPDSDIHISCLHHGGKPLSLSGLWLVCSSVKWAPGNTCLMGVVWVLIKQIFIQETLAVSITPTSSEKTRRGQGV